MRKLFSDFTGKRGYERFTDELIEATKGYADIMQIGTVDEYQIFKTVINPDAKRTLLFIAGLHGNEQPPCWGMLDFLKAKIRIPEDLRIVMIPLANPTGFVAGTRENANGVDINRHFKVDDMKDECEFLHHATRDEKVILLTTLHEDPEMHGFYLYYTKHRELAEDLRDLAKRFFSIYGKDRRDPVDGEKHLLHNDKIHDGLIPLPHTRRDTIEDMFYNKGVPYITTETPGKGLWRNRVEYNARAIRHIIHSF